MIIRPIHDILLLPDVSYYFRKEFFKDWTGEDLDTGTEILFALMKEGKEVSEMTEEDFYPIGLLARIEGFNEDDNVQVRTLERVDIEDLEIQDGYITASAASRPETPLLCSPVWADMRQMSKSQSAVIVHSSAANSRLRTASVMPSPLVQYDVPV